MTNNYNIKEFSTLTDYQVQIRTQKCSIDKIREHLTHYKNVLGRAQPALNAYVFTGHDYGC